MNILVAIKQVPDTGSLLQLSNGKLEEEGVKWIISPYDEFALQEGLKLKSQLKGKLFALSLGPSRSEEALLTALSLGADEAFHLLSSPSPSLPSVFLSTFDSLSNALLLSKKILKSPDLSLILCGKEAGDSNEGSLPQMLAGLLNLPFVTNARTVDYEGGDFSISREFKGGGMEILRASPPLLISMGKGEKEPAPPSLMGIMQAKKKPFYTEEVEAERAERSCWQLDRMEKLKTKTKPILKEGRAEEQAEFLLKILKEAKLLKEKGGL